jgi:tripartite-type tricarboxylate transporter receptor subunit TctC
MTNVKLPNRRQVLHLAASAAALPVMSRSVWAQAYPSRPARIIVGFPAGGSNDLHARLMAEWLSKQFNRSFIVENRAGAAGNIGTEAVVRAAPDCYTLYLAGSSEMRNEILYRDLKFSFMRDLSPVAGVMSSPNVLIVHPAFSVRSVNELIAAANANPDALAVASPGVGTSAHVAWELFKSMTGTRMLHVPYRGGAAAITDMLGQRVQVYFSTISDAMEHIKAGSLRAIAVTGTTRTKVLPDVPTISESVPGYESVGWLGVLAPRDTPVALIEALNKSINAGLADPKIKQTIEDWGEIPFIGSPADFGRFIAAENEKWGKVIRAANIKVE